MIALVPVCYIRTSGDSIPLGTDMLYDIFPATLDEFFALSAGSGYALAWSQDSWPAFPPLKGPDSNGLRGKADGGADRTMRFGTPAGAPSDSYEMQLGTNPQDVESDDDGFSGYHQIIQTDPVRADSDGDGLTDKERSRLGVGLWICSDGGQLRTWVTSEPSGWIATKTP